MARLQFRITSIALNDEEDVSEVTAVVRDDAYEVIKGILGDVTTTATARGGTEMTIVLPIIDAADLFRACGQMNGLDPRYAKGSHEIYESLTAVFYGLMGE